MKKSIIISILALLFITQIGEAQVIFRQGKQKVKVKQQSQLPKYELTIYPLIGKNRINDFWVSPEIFPTGDNKTAFRQDIFFNRQFAVNVGMTLFKGWRWNQGVAFSHLRMKGNYERQVFELSTTHQYYIGANPQTNFSDVRSNRLALISNEGISLDATVLSVGIDMKTQVSPQWWFTIGGGVQHQRSELQSRKDVDYLPWSLELAMGDAILNPFRLKPYTEFGIGIGNHLYLHSNFRFYPLGIRTGTAYQLYASSTTEDRAEKVPLAVNTPLFSLSFGVGVQF